MKLPRSIALAALAVLGCRSSSPSTRAPDPPDPRVELPGDPELEELLETVNARTADSDGRTVLRMDLRNKSTSPLAFAWAIEWFDRSGGLVAGSARVWRPMTLAAGATSSIETPVPTTGAITWRLRAARPG